MSVLLRLAYANVLIALNAGGFACAALLAARVEISWGPLVLPTIAMYGVYTYDKVLRFDPQDSINDPKRCAFIVAHRGLLLTSAAVLLLGGLVVAWCAGWLAFILFVLPFISGILYAAPVLPKRYRIRRIKDATGLKSIYVAAVWSATAALLPLSIAGVGLDSAIAGFAALWVFLRMFINTVYFDLGDVEGDRTSGTQTIPVVFGFSQTRTLLFAVNFVSAWILWVGVVAVGLPPSLWILALAVIYGHIYLKLASPTRDLGFLCDVVVDSEGLVLGFLCLLLSL